MRVNRRETEESYKPIISDRYYKYLDDRSVVSDEYFTALKKGQFGILEENVLIIDESPFCLNCILGESEDSIFDIIGTNSLYNLSKEDGTVFAVLYGDDYLFFKPNDKRIYYKSISSDDEILVASTYNEFLGKIKFQEDER